MARATRRPKTNRVARTRAGGEWTEAAFWSFIRSALRQTSKRWPPRKQCELSSRQAYVGPNKRQKWEYECSLCNRWFKRTEMQVDHIVPCGSIKGFDDIGPFCERLFCEADGFRMLCGDCDSVDTRKR